MWVQAGLLTTSWISQIASAELANIPGSRTTIVSVQPVEEVLNNVYSCYNCTVSPLPTCVPISWPAQLGSYYSSPVNDSSLWYLRFTLSPSGLCPYYLVFAFGSVSVGVNIVVREDNYTLEVTILGNTYQPAQLVYSVTEPSQNIISPTYILWGVCITLSPDNTVSVLFPCLTYDGWAIFFFAHNVSIPFSESNSPRLPLTVTPGYNVSDVNLFTFTSAWSLSALCAWFSTSGIPQPLQWVG